MATAQTQPAAARPRVDDQIAKRIPPLTEEELEALEENLLADGCRDPLVVWLETGILLDGHNRLAICERHEIRYRTAVVSLPDQEAAHDWIDANQLGRRNLSPDAASLLRGRRYNRTKKQGERTDLTSRQSGEKSATSVRLGKEHGVSARTIERDGAFAAALERVSAVKPDLEAAVLAGDETKANVMAAAHLLDELPDETAKAVRKEESVAKAINSVRTGRKRANAARALETSGQFAVIYADPPWRYDQDTVRGSAEAEYDTMDLQSICALKMGGRSIQDLAAPDCVLFLWATNPLLPEALRVIEAWGFAYKTNICWVKSNFGLGFFVRSKHELLLIATRGSLTPDKFGIGASVIEAKNEKHSRKPDDFARRIQEMYPAFPRIELFAREKRAGWEVWGNEV